MFDKRVVRREGYSGDLTIALLCFCLALALVLPGNIRAKIRMSYSPVWQNMTITVPCGAGFADFDGNGWPDLVISRGVDAAALPNNIFFNYDGEISQTADWVSDDVYASGQLYIGDFNNDLEPDLLVSNTGVSADHIPQSFYMNSGGLSTLPTWQAPPTRSFVCTGGDPDGDGDLDISFSRGYWVTSDQQTAVVYGNDNGTFSSTPLWESSDAYYGVGIAMCDVDIDGDLDLIVGSRGSGIRIYDNSNGVLSSSPIWQSNPYYGSRMMALGDVDGDGYRDLATAIPGSSGSCALFMNIGGTFDVTPVWTVGPGTEPSCVAWGDVDGDGDLDLATGAWFATARIYENVGGVLSSVPIWTCPTDVGRIQQVAWGDYDKDYLVDSYEIFTGNGSRKLFYLERMPIHNISSIDIDGVPLDESSYCFDNSQGWVSLATAPESGSSLTIHYTYSNDLDLVITGSNGVFLFENRSIAAPDEVQILLLQDQQQGTSYDGNDARDNLLKQFDDFGWVMTTAGLTGNLNRCSYAASFGAMPLTTDLLISDITDITEYDIVCLLPCASGLVNLINDPTTMNLISTAAAEGIEVAAWCRAVRVLAAADLIDGLSVVGHIDYQSEYEAAGATFIGNNNPPIIRGNIVTGVRSLYYRDEMCGAMARALPPKISVTGIFPEMPTQLDSIIITSFISDFAPVDTAFAMVDTGTGYFELELFDDGLHHDESPGDSLYGGILPPISDGTEVTYYIKAVEDTIHTSVYDPPDAPATTHSFTIDYRMPDISINEIMSSANDCCPDEYGDYDNWFELYNSESVNIDLSGVYLTDNLTEPTKFQVGDITIPAGGFALFWADNETSEGEMHAGFVLNPAGGNLALYDSDRHGNVVMDADSYISQRAGFSYGIIEGEGDSWVLFHTPTPGQANGSYICGDVNLEYSVNILDIVYLINYLYKSGPAPTPAIAADVNHDEMTNILDIVFLINYIYKNGPKPACE